MPQLQHPIYVALNSRPINRQAARAACQSACEDERGFLTRQELTRILERIQRKHRLLKRVLGITKKTQHTNTLNAFKRRLPNHRVQQEPRAFAEYLRCGKEINRLSIELALDRKCRQLAAQAFIHLEV